MSEPMIPAGAFAAMRAGGPQPPQSTEPVQPKTITRKAEPKAELEEKPKEDMTPTERKIWKIKADDSEFEFDATDEENVKRALSKLKGSELRLQKASDLRKQAETFFDMLRDPKQLRKVLTDPLVNVDLKKFAEDYVWEQMQEERMTPEQKTQRDRDRKLEEYEAGKRSEEDSKKLTAKQAQVVAFENAYEAKIMKALEVGGIPKTPAAVKRMADYLQSSINHNLDLSPEELVGQLRQDYMTEFSSLFQSADGDSLFKFIGEDNAKKLRQADLKRLKSTQATPFQNKGGRVETKAKSEPKKLSGSDWKAAIQKEFLARSK